jgi:60 kDa SS-A/Ro ribonucleoprotein
MSADSSVLFDSLAAMASSSSSSAPSGQQVPAKGREADMQANRGGGYSFKVSDKDIMTRVLVLGTNKNIYAATARELTVEAITFIKKMIDEGKGGMIIDLLLDIYESGRAPKQDPTFFTLALLCGAKDVEIRRRAYDMVSRLRTFSQLYTWKGFQKKALGTKGNGKLAKGAFWKLLTEMSPLKLAYQATKYPQRTVGSEKWGFTDLIKCAHTKGSALPSIEYEFIIRYMVKGYESAMILATEKLSMDNLIVQYMSSVHNCKTLAETDENVQLVVNLIHEQNLPREVMPTWALKHKKVWEALLLGKERKWITMPMTALIRNLAVMTVRGIFDDKDSPATELVCKHLTNMATLKKNRIHPVQVLLAYLTYKSGHGDKGSLAWIPNPQVLKAIHDAVELSFGTIEPTGMRIFHGLDGSGSMMSPIPCLPQLTSSQAVAIMAKIFSKSEKAGTQDFAFFSSKNGLYNSSGLMPVVIDGNDSIEVLTQKAQYPPWGSTDCALPILSAMDEYKKSKKVYDAFIIYTDNDTNSRSMHPFEALKKYRELTGIPAKMVVVATTPGSNTIADPSDNGMMDICGFDTHGPKLLHAFLTGKSEKPVDEDDGEGGADE